MPQFARCAVKTIVCTALLIGSAVQPAMARSFELAIDDWIRPRSGERVIEFKALENAVDAWGQAPDGSVIEIRYPGGEQGGLWARELADWLVAFGVPSNRIRLAAGSARPDRMVLVITKPGQ